MKNNNALSHNLPQNLRPTIADLETVNPWLGLWRFVSLGLVVLSLATFGWLRTGSCSLPSESRDSASPSKPCLTVSRYTAPR